MEAREKNRASDYSQIVLITVLYTLQGIPLGLVHGSLPYLLKKHLSYADLAVFSFASYPYLFKLFWSPLVDSAHFSFLGRRKSWIVPCQILMGVTLLLFSPYITASLESRESLPTLTAVMFTMILLAATQDIAVDAWALELLSQESRAFGSVCQSAGQYLGFLLSFPVMVAVNSEEFSRKFLGTSGAALPISQFFSVSGLVFIGISLYVQFFTREGQSSADESLSFSAILRSMLEVARLPHMKDLVVVLLTVRLGLAAFDSVFMLQLTEHGLDEMEMGMMSMGLIPVEIALTVTIGVILAKRFSLSGYRLGFLIRVLANVYNYVLLSTIPAKANSWGTYTAIVAGCLASAVGANMMFSVITSLFFRISQQSLGGTYMTFLATVLNFGAQFPNTLALYAVDLLSSKGTCEGVDTVCDKSCTTRCVGAVNGFYSLGIASILLSIAYYFLFLRKKTAQFERLSAQDWHYVAKTD